MAMGPSKPASALRIACSSNSGRGAGRNAIQHLAKDNAAHAFQLACVAQLPQHAIHLVGLCADVFKKEKLVFGLRLPLRAQQRNQNAEAAAVENAFRCAGLQHAQPFGRANAVRLACKRRVETRQVHAVFKIEIRSHHRAMKRRQTQSSSSRSCTPVRSL